MSMANLENDQERTERHFAPASCASAWFVKKFLKPGEYQVNRIRCAQIRHGIGDRVAILESQQWREFVLVQLFHTGIHVMLQNKIQEYPLLGVKRHVDVSLRARGALLYKP